jgi:hypothetical protein
MAAKTARRILGRRLGIRVEGIGFLFLSVELRSCLVQTKVLEPPAGVLGWRFVGIDVVVVPCGSVHSSSEGIRVSNLVESQLALECYLCRAVTNIAGAVAVGHRW